jgi:hypothetical protein
MADELKNGSAAKTGMNPAESGPAERASQGGHDAARRRAIKAGLIGVPVILTLKGKAAMAQNTTPSALASPTYGSHLTLNQLDKETEPKRG